MEKVTVADYAALKRISAQAVYKKIQSGKLRTVEEETNGRTIKYVVLDAEEPQTNTSAEGFQPLSTTPEVELNHDFNANSTPNQPNSTGEEVEKEANSTADSTEIQPPFNSVFEFLQEQLREKDKQIARLQDQLEKTNELLRNAQTLQAQSNLLLLGHTTPPEEEQKEEEPIIEHTEARAVPQEEPKKKKNFFKRLFGID